MDSTPLAEVRIRSHEDRPTTDTRRTIRDELVQTLLHSLERDLSDSRNLSDIRIRFVPRQALIDTISQQQVVQLLATLSESNVTAESVARISPQGMCRCNTVGCTGARMILATLLLIGREDLITTLFSSTSGPTVCDQDLPFGTKENPEKWPSGDHREENKQSLLRGPTQTPSADAEIAPALFYQLSLHDRALFSYWQWHFLSPYLTPSVSGQTLPDEVSLPWQKLTRVRDPVEGEVSSVQRIKIFCGSHNLAHNVENVFALKTFENIIIAKRTEQIFTKELEANRNAPPHSRIVPVLAAFKHRRRCHLILPWADGGSLADIWEKYSPMHTQSRGQEHLATWCSESWLLNECTSIAEALAAIHGLADDPRSGYGRQIHADLKPENILCFFSDKNGERSLTLKLADLGEAIRVKDGDGIKAHMVPHTKTYRPPEPNPPGLIGFNYDVWCLGCLYLEFITWFLDGWEGVEAFSKARENEGDDLDSWIAKIEEPGIIEDTFFRKVTKTQMPKINWGSRTKTSINAGQSTTRASLWITSSFGIEHKIKRSVLTHIETLKNLERCETSVYLKDFIEYIADKMLVTDIQERVQSNEVLAKLRSLSRKSCE